MAQFRFERTADGSTQTIVIARDDEGNPIETVSPGEEFTMSLEDAEALLRYPLVVTRLDGEFEQPVQPFTAPPSGPVTDGTTPPI